MTEQAPEPYEPEPEAPDEEGQEPTEAVDPLANEDLEDSWGDDDD